MKSLLKRFEKYFFNTGDMLFFPTQNASMPTGRFFEFFLRWQLLKNLILKGETGGAAKNGKLKRGEQKKTTFYPVAFWSSRP